MRKALGLTLVMYEQGDKLGKLLSLVSMTPIFAVVAVGTVFAVRRELHSATLLAGLVTSTLINMALKVVIKEPRPAGHERDDEFGMPSDHSQLTAFLAAYLSVCMLRGMLVRTRAPAIALLWAWLGVVGFSRVYLGYHTVQQVAVGALVGCALGVCWYATTFAVLQPTVFPRILQHPLARFFLLRDNTAVPYVLEREWDAAQRRASSPGPQRKPKTK